ncbi:hypothetical protein QMS86_13920 [Cronobacter dublinensis]|uniref:hypothetical protein n=1 Tax=Cronobacter dublinensis TaxID=413497 RepID=UPI003ADCFE0B
MEDLIVQRYDIVTVHRHGEMSDELREKPNGNFCYYKEANESHKEVLAEYSEPVNESLLEALQGFVDLFPDVIDGDAIMPALDKAYAAIAKAIGEEE